jgi:hypothetical protein
MQRITFLLCIVTVAAASAATHNQLLRAEPRENTYAVLEKVDQVLDKELDLLMKTDDDKTQGKELAIHPMASEHRLLSIADIKDGAVGAGKFFKTLVGGNPKIWFAVKFVMALTVAFAAPPVAAAFMTAAIAVKVGEAMVTVAESREHFAQITDAKEKGFITDAMAAACKKGDAVKAVAAVFWNWCSIIVPVPLE